MYRKSGVLSEYVRNESGSGRSLMWIKNKIGPRTEPWGTLAVTSPGFDCSPDMQVIWVLGL